MRRVSAVFVILLSATLAGCGREPTPPPAQPAPTRAPAVATPEETALLALLPATGAAANWSQTREPRRYGPGNLWEYIDGAAETYLAYSFQELATTSYAHTPMAVEATADIYKMADALNAFGICAQERTPTCEAVPVGVEGCYAGAALAFWSGPYYVKLTAFKDHVEVKPALMALAAAVASKLGPAGAGPPQAGWFPPGNLVPRSVKYVPKDALGQSYLANAFEAEYTEGASSWKLVVITFDSSEAAAQSLARYKAFIGSGGKVARELNAPGHEGFVGADGFYGTVTAARSGTALAIALGVPSEKVGTATIQVTFARMKGTP